MWLIFRSLVVWNSSLACYENLSRVPCVSCRIYGYATYPMRIFSYLFAFPFPRDGASRELLATRLASLPRTLHTSRRARTAAATSRLYAPNAVDVIVVAVLLRPPPPVLPDVDDDGKIRMQHLLPLVRPWAELPMVSFLTYVLLRT